MAKSCRASLCHFRRSKATLYRVKLPCSCFSLSRVVAASAASTCSVSMMLQTDGWLWPSKLSNRRLGSKPLRSCYWFDLHYRESVDVHCWREKYINFSKKCRLLTWTQHETVYISRRILFCVLPAFFTNWTAYDGRNISTPNTRRIAAMHDDLKLVVTWTGVGLADTPARAYRSVTAFRKNLACFLLRFALQNCPVFGYYVQLY